MLSRRCLLVGTALAVRAAEYAPVHVYDPARDAAKDIAAATAEAKRTGRHVLVEVGGKWCGWCRILDRFFDDNKSLSDLRDRNYVLLKVNFSPENENKAALSKYPPVPGYPHLFILDGAGALLHSQDTGALEEGKGYSLAKFREFLEKWAPKR